MNNNKKLSNRVKISIQIGLILGLVTISIWGYLPIIDFFDEWLYLNFSHLMFIFGIFLGICYYILCLLKYFLAKKDKIAPLLSYLLEILPATFLLNCFIWYFYMFFNKLISETKADANYYQTLMIAFSIYFLTVKIGKEVGNLFNSYNKF